MSTIDRLQAISGMNSVQPSAQPGSSSPIRPAKPTQNAEFSDLLTQQIEHKNPLKFSAHAQNRLLHRNILLTENQMNRLENSVQEAEKKGARDSLVMLDNLALVVSVRNRTVVTALDNAAQSGAVFTQIDSAVIA